jgi:hypothetical protein
VRRLLFLLTLLLLTVAAPAARAGQLGAPAEQDPVRLGQRFAADEDEAPQSPHPTSPVDAEEDESEEEESKEGGSALVDLRTDRWAGARRDLGLAQVIRSWASSVHGRSCASRGPPARRGSTAG